MDPSTAPAFLAFGEFHLDTRKCLLYRGEGEIVPLPSRAFDTLLYMAAHPHQLVDKQELMKAVWPHAIVEENNLSQHISLLRKVLGEAPGEHRFIVTVPGRGFRFVPVVRAVSALPWEAGPAEPEEALPVLQPREPVRRLRMPHRLWIAATVALLAVAAGAAFLRNAAAPVTSETSIAVLAFADLSPDGDQEYFSDGLSEELINQLARVPHLRVIGRSSSFVFKGRNEDPRRIAEMLDVDHILEGSVRKSGDRVRISAKLIDPADGSQRWSATYERQLGDVFAVQDEIAHTVATQLRLKMDERDLRTGGTTNLEAYDQFLAGRAMLNSNDAATMQGAAPLFERALRIDPGFMAARLWLIDAYLRTSLARADLKQAAIRRQDELIDEVAMRAAGSPQASFALSYRAARGRDLIELERLLRHAMQVGGSGAERAHMRYGQFLLGTGDAAGAERELGAVAGNDPLDDFVRMHVLQALDIAGQPEEARREVQRFLQTPGGNTPSIHGAAISMAQGQHDEAWFVAAVQAAVDAGAISHETAAAMHQMLEDPQAARQALRQRVEASGLDGNVYHASNIALDAAYLGDRELALEALRAMLNSGFAFETVAFVLWRPVFSSLRDDPEFIDIVRQLGLEKYWRTRGQWGQFCLPDGDRSFTCH